MKFGLQQAKFEAFPQFLTQFSHVSRHLKASSRKQKLKFRKNCFNDVVSDLWKSCCFLSTKLCNLYIFIDILELRVENKTKNKFKKEEEIFFLLMWCQNFGKRA